MRIQCRTILASAVAALAAVSSFAGTISFTPGNTEIAVAAQAPGPVKLAALEMKDFLSRVLGTPVPIVNKIDPAKATIILGTNEWSKAAGIDVSSLKTDGYIHKTSGNRLYIAGMDSSHSIDHCVWSRFFKRGTLMGTYAFLEKYAGCRFYFPGELGEIAPRKASVDVPALDFRDAPAMAGRKYGYHQCGKWYDETLSESKVTVLKNRNILRLRMASGQYKTSHGLRYFRHYDRFGKTHPEYFMLRKDGSRVEITDKSPLHVKGLLCFSNQELREIIYQDVRAYLSGQSPESRGLKCWDSCGMWERRFVGLHPEDCLLPCQCERCKATYRPDLGASFMTDLIWGFTKEIAERIAADGFDAVLLQSSYSNWLEPPEFDIPANVSVETSATGPWAVRKPGEMKRDLALIEKWTKKIDRSVMLQTYPGKFGELFGFQDLRFPGVPQITPRAWGAFYKAVAPYISGGRGGTYAETCSDRFLFDALNVYVFSRVAWDPSVDVDSILDEHYRLMYGPAAKDIQALFEELEDVWLDRIYGETVQTNFGPLARVPSAFRLWTEIYTQEKVAELLAATDRAAAKVAPGSMEARRIALVRSEIIGHLAKNSKAYMEGLSVEREKAARAARRPVNLVKDFKPVTITVDNTMTNKPFHRVKYSVPEMRQGRKYRVSFFVKGENVQLNSDARQGGAQAVPWGNEDIDRGWSFPKPGATGTFDWVHFSREFEIPAKLDGFRPEVDLRIFGATGTAHFDGLLIEEIK